MADLSLELRPGLNMLIEKSSTGKKKEVIKVDELSQKGYREEIILSQTDAFSKEMGGWGAKEYNK